MKESQKRYYTREEIRIIESLESQNTKELKRVLDTVNKHPSEMAKPLIQTIRFDHLDGMCVLLDRGVDPEQGYDTTTPLFYAAQYNKPKFVKLLLNRGVNPATNIVAGSTAFSQAVMQGHAKCVHHFVDNGIALDLLPLPYTMNGHNASKATVEHYADYPYIYDIIRDSTNQKSTRQRSKTVHLLLENYEISLQKAQYRDTILQELRAHGFASDDEVALRRI